MFVPIIKHRHNPVVFREAFSDASALKQNISQLTKIQNIAEGSEAARSAENISAMSSHSGSASSLNSLESSAKGKKDRFANFKKSHMSHSTGDLNIGNRLNLSLINDLQMNDSQFFEVMYVGKIKVSHKKVPKTFIDDAIPKFLAHDKMKMIKNLEASSKQASASNSNLEATGAGLDDSDQNKSEIANVAGENEPIIQHDRLKEILRSDSMEAPVRNRSASIGCVEQNRTMVFIIGRNDVRLISPDRKQVLLHKNFKDLVNIVQGTINTEHFGIICSETKENKSEYIGYCFKCQSESIAHDILTSVFKSLETQEQTQHLTEPEECDHCPMVWFHRLLAAVEGMSEKKTRSAILRFTEEYFGDDDYVIFMETFHASDKANNDQNNKFLLSLVEAHCQKKQLRHIHDSDSNRSEFINQYLGGTFLSKAKRSLSNSFDHLMKRRGSSTLVDTNNNFASEIEDFKRAKPVRSLSLAPNAPQTLTLRVSPERQNTLKMDMFIKVGNTAKDHQDVTWRQNILKNVAAQEVKGDDSIKFLPIRSRKKLRQKKERNSEELRGLWKFAGKQVILLIRMEKENARLQERQNEHDIKILKLDYDEIIPCDPQLTEVWNNYISQASKTLQPDNRLFLQAIKSGVPKAKRGDVWLMLAEQFRKNHPPLDVSDYLNFHVPYYDLLKNLTEHQHAIFMDIGRTFPNHEYYKAPFGKGQLSLFNVLKAYSILDPELGYCQGLAFICGVLLLHLSEEQAFDLLKHLMFERQMRFDYLPDMKQFQTHLYQLSRLIKDNLPEIYDLFDKNDVATTLFASSWMLTIFSSSFELGFVTKVYDLLLFASNEVIFRVILALLQVHKDELLKLDCFEDIMDYLKNVIPNVDESTMAKVFKNVYNMNVTRQLLDYKIEYNVLKEEIHNTSLHMENLKHAMEENKRLEQKLQMAESNIERLDNIRNTQHQENTTMQMQIKSLENTIQRMGEYLISLSIDRRDVEIPTDIRRLLQQYESQHNQQRQQQMKRRPVFQDRKIGKSVSVNNSMGMSLKVLVEQNENDQLHTPPSAVTPSPEVCCHEDLTARINEKSNASDEASSAPPKKKYFENIYQQIQLKEDKSKPVEQTALEETEHPLQNSDINFQFNTMQLKTIKTTNNFRKK